MSQPSPPPSESAICPTCGAEIGAKDKFCSMCGANLANASQWKAPTPATVTNGDDIAPLPGPDSQRQRRKRKRKAPWYKRPLVMVPLVLLLLLAGAGGVIAWQTRAALKDVHSVSTPPPEVALSREEGDDAVQEGGDTVQIDTGPAQAALAAREQRSTITEPTAEPTSEPTTSDAAGDPSEPTVAQPTGEPDTTTDNGSTVEPTASGSAGETSPTTVVGNEPRGQSVIDDSATPTEPSAGMDSLTASPITTPASSETPTPTAPPPVVAAGGVTVLLMGVDSREGEAIDIGVRPDSLGVLHIEEETGACRILAVPRDSRAILPGYGYSKINHALAVAGIPYELLVVEEYLGLEIDNYALIDFSGLEKVVDELGGVTVHNPEAFEMGGQTFAAGTLTLNGEQALLYSRFRGDSQGDFGRISRQQQVLRALLDNTASINVVSTLPSMFTVLSDHFRTDFGVNDLVSMANDYRSTCTADTIETRTIPGDVSMEYDELMQMDLSFVTSDPAAIQEHVDWLLGETPVEESAGSTDMDDHQQVVLPPGRRLVAYARSRKVIQHP